MKPLIRWTLASPKLEGFEALLEAIAKWAELYPEFDRVVCCNKRTYVDALRERNITIFDQTNSMSGLWEPKSAGWKLCPPRLRMSSHEIICDNDLIMFQRSDYIDQFLESDSTFLSCEAIRRNVGNFEPYVSADFKLNTGLIGLPPNYDFAWEIEEMQRKSGLSGWDTLFDEQGLVSSIFSRKSGHRTIPFSEICNTTPMNETYNTPPEFYTAKGIHFCGLNYGVNAAWKLYKRSGR